MVKFVHLQSSIRTFFERAGRKIFLTLLGYNVAKGCANPRNSTWFTRPFLLVDVRGWGLGTRLGGREVEGGREGGWVGGTEGGRLREGGREGG